jgi:pimeloyl-ACP methyl ester carboxylesterase
MFRILIVSIAALVLPLDVSAAESSGYFVDLPESKIWVTDTGGNGDPVILLHAHTGTSESWEKQTPALARAGYRVIAFDRPGWGKSVAKAGVKPVPAADIIDALTDRLKLTSFHLIGVAHGGYIAVDYAAWRPARVKSLVIAASGLGIAGKVKGGAETDALRKRAALPDFAHWPPEMRELSPFYRGTDPSGVARWKAIEAHAMQPGADDSLLHSPNDLDKVASLTMPVLVIAGDDDLTTPSAAIRLWAKALKRHDWLLIPEAGHAVNWEQPDAFNRAVIAFLKKQS